MESELVNLPKLQSSNVLAVLRPQVTTASCVFVLLSMILASVIPTHFVCGLHNMFLGKASNAVSHHISNNEEQEQTRAHSHDESSYADPELLDSCDTYAPSSFCRADEALKTCE